MPKTVEHTWRERTQDGEVRFLRAIRRRDVWSVASKLASEERWTHLDPASTEDLLSLRDVVWRKYQRRRVAWEAVASVDKLLEERGVTPEGDPIDHEP